jgi:hypothetical protein
VSGNSATPGIGNAGIVCSACNFEASDFAVRIRMTCPRKTICVRPAIQSMTSAAIVQPAMNLQIVDHQLPAVTAVGAVLQEAPAAQRARIGSANSLLESAPRNEPRRHKSRRSGHIFLLLSA